MKTWLMAAPVNVTITGGKIEAHGSSGAGIGTGYGYNAGSWVSDTSSVTITGGEINADADTGAGIGSGSHKFFGAKAVRHGL